MNGKYRVLILAYLFLSLLLSSAYLFLPSHFQSLDSRVRDFYFKFRGPEQASDAVVIVDIDEKSIKSLGQWPWERDKIAKILQNLTQMNAAIIGLDIIFSEADKTSPTKIAQTWHLDSKNLPDYDLILAQTVAQTPTILGYTFDFDVKNENEAPLIPAIFMQRHKPKMNFIPHAVGVLTNLELLQTEAYSSGYINNIPDETGIIRSVPMLIGYDMEIYPSLAFEMYRIAKGFKKVSINYSEVGVESISLGKEIIACDRFARLHINFKGPFKSYTYISALDIYNQTVAKKLIDGKLVLIGTSAYGLMDLRSTPMDSVIAGVELHANMLDNLLNHDMLYKASWVESVDILAILIITFIILFLVSYFHLIFLISSYLMLFVGVLYFNYYMLFSQHIIINVIFPIVTLVFSLVTILGIKYFFESRQKELIKGSFSKKVSKQVMEDLLLHPESTDMNSREVNASIYFSDIRSFTSISETLESPKRITDFLNFYMNAMVIVVEKNRGTIDKFIGDAVMAYWNAPLEVHNHADKAVQTALEQVGMRDELNITIKKEYGFDVDYGIGINTGDAVVGEIGSKGRSDYTIIGDSVNLASRLEGLCKPYKVRLVISEFTKELLQEEYVIQLLDIVRVKGKHKPVKIYEVQSMGIADEEKLAEFSLYEKAHDLYVASKFSQAELMFNVLYTKYQKYLYKLYEERCGHLKDESLENFDGVFEFTTK